jgi:hypothetical protein
MDIITEVEKCCLNLEKSGKEKEADKLRHQVTHGLLQAPKPKSNLTSQQKVGLSYLRKTKDIAVTPYDKGIGFVTLERDELVKKSEAEFKNVSLDTSDTTVSFERKIQVILRELHKEGKLDDRTYKAIYPSGSVTLTSYPVIKAHKPPEKNYPARNITSHIGSPQENLLSHLNSILKPFIESHPFTCKNSAQFVAHIKTLTLNPNDRMISFDAEALFPSVPIKDIDIIKCKLDADATLSTRTKLTPEDICKLLYLCLSSSDFILMGNTTPPKTAGQLGFHQWFVLPRSG